MPKYNRPEAPIPSQWPTGEAYKQGSQGPNAPDIRRQEFFGEPKLREVIAMALANNRDIRIAVLNVERSRQLYRIQGSELFPTINAGGTFSKERVPGILSGSGRAATVELYNLNLGMTSYEIDLFGRIRSLKELVFRQYLATEQARRSSQITLVAEVANAYLTLAADKERLRLAQETLKAQKDSYNLIKGRFNVGTSSELDLRQAQTRVDAARVDIAFFAGKLAQDENILNFLAGTTVPGELQPVSFEDSWVRTDLTAYLPSELLQRRPDILVAEEQLKAANANIGAARANFFPQIRLSTSIGTTSDELSGLFGGSSGTWAFLPQVTLPIFTGGRNLAILRASEVDRKISLAQYERAIQNAFREVADALAQNGTLQDQFESQQSLVEATEASLRLSQARYLGGIDSYLNVLDAQRSLYAAQQDLISLRQERIANILTLYKVLGGGWSDEDKVLDETLINARYPNGQEN